MVAEATVIAEVVRLPGFVELAPTVAASAMASSESVAQLRAEGFAVVEDPSSGSVVVRRPRKARAAAPVEEVAPVAVDLPDLDADEPSTAQIVRGRNRALSQKAVALLAGAIDEQSDVRIDYVDGKASPPAAPSHQSGGTGRSCWRGATRGRPTDSSGWSESSRCHQCDREREAMGKVINIRKIRLNRSLHPLGPSREASSMALASAGSAHRRR